MNLATRALFGAGAAGLGILLAATNGFSAVITGLTTAGVLAATGVALSSQQMRIRRQERLVYRPVYVRAATVHRPVRYDDL